MAHVPVRRCVACRLTAPKSDLVRLAVAGEAVVVDPPARQPGRGAYVCTRPDCVEAALRRDAAALARSLRYRRGGVTVDDDDIRKRWKAAAQSRASNHRHAPLEEYS